MADVFHYHGRCVPLPWPMCSTAMADVFHCHGHRCQSTTWASPVSID